MKALVTSKGQVTIPKALRDRLGIQPGAQVNIEIVEDALRLRKVEGAKKRTVLGCHALGCLKTDLKDRSVAPSSCLLGGPYPELVGFSLVVFAV